MRNHKNGSLKHTGVLNVMLSGKARNFRTLKTESMIYGGRQALKAKKIIEAPYVERLWGEHSAAICGDKSIKSTQSTGNARD